MFLLLDQRGKKYLVQGDKDVHTDKGVIEADKLKKENVGREIESHIEKKFYLLEPNIIDFLEKAKRGPQTMTLKDCSMVAGYAGLCSGDKVVDAGSGSGILAMFLANIVYPQKLVTYEVREDFYKLAQNNFEKFGFDNIKIKNQDIYQGIEEERLDLITLDLPEPWKVVSEAQKKLKIGGYLISYSPSINQSSKLTKELADSEKFEFDTFECVRREWNTKTLRPYSRMIAHTGFITVARIRFKE